MAYRDVGMSWSCGSFKTIYMHETDPQKTVFEVPPHSNNYRDIDGNPPDDEFMEWIKADCA